MGAVDRSVEQAMAAFNQISWWLPRKTPRGRKAPRERHLMVMAAPRVKPWLTESAGRRSSSQKQVLRCAQDDNFKQDGNLRFHGHNPRRNSTGIHRSQCRGEVLRLGRRTTHASGAAGESAGWRVPDYGRTAWRRRGLR